MGQQLHLAGMDSGMAFIVTQIAIVVDRTTSRSICRSADSVGEHGARHIPQIGAQTPCSPIRAYLGLPYKNGKTVR